MNQERLMKILLALHISEKATIVAEKHQQFVFRVQTDARKTEIKQAVEMMFDVKVDKVQVLNQKGKTKRTGAISGRRNHMKKAYVSLKPGFDIDLMGPQ